MTAFKNLVFDLNHRISKSSSILVNFQQERAIHQDKKLGQKAFFYKEDKVVKHNYTFHYGGSGEFQFNIGIEKEYKGRPVFRFGVAFSLEPSQTVPNPEKSLEEQRQRFNNFIKDNPNFLEKFSAWNYKKEERSIIGAVKTIKKHQFKNGVFLFFGTWISKEIEDFDEADINTIVETLEYFLPIYQYVQMENDNAIVQKRLARICYNENNWVSPSGLKGKSQNKDSYERRSGYSHEEWLFDFSKVIDGYHYSFLQAFNARRETYEGKIFDVSLFTINSNINEKFWIGEIKNAEVIDIETTEEIIEIYEEEGWLDEMREQIEDLGFPPNSIDEFSDYILNFRFKPEDYYPLVEPILIPKEEEIVTGHRYSTLFHFKEDLEQLKTPIEDFHLVKQANKKALKTKTKRHFVEKSTEIELLHNQISERLPELLKERYDVVCTEASTMNGLGTRIDIAAQKGEEYHFFEIKTYASLMTCIRQAVGQLIEYSYFPKRQVASKLYIVSPHEAKSAEKDYILHLRNVTGLPLYYMAFDLEKEVIVQEF